MADRVVGPQALNVEPLDPRLRASRRDSQVQSMLVRQLGRPLGRLDPSHREYRQSRTPTRTRFDGSMEGVRRDVKTLDWTDKCLFINLLR